LLPLTTSVQRPFSRSRSLGQTHSIFLFTHHEHLVELCRQNLGEGQFHLHRLAARPDGCHSIWRKSEQGDSGHGQRGQFPDGKLRWSGAFPVVLAPTNDGASRTGLTASDMRSISKLAATFPLPPDRAWPRSQLDRMTQTASIVTCYHHHDQDHSSVPFAPFSAGRFWNVSDGLTLGDRAVSGASRQPQGDPVRRYAPGLRVCRSGVRRDRS